MANNFISAYGPKPVIKTPVGSDIKPEFGYVKKIVDDFDNEGKKAGSHEEIVFEQTGTSSISEYINSFTDTTDIKKIYERYQVGDVSVLTKRVGDFIDTLGCPDNLLDAKLMLMNGSKAFDELPASIKEKYDNDALKFVEACQNGSISQVISGLNNQVVEGEKATKTQADEIAELRAQIASLQKGGVDYE